MGKGKSRGDLTDAQHVRQLTVPGRKRRGQLTPPQPPALVKRRHSPGGKILCPEGHIVPRRRFNNALRLRQKPSCNQCGSTDLQIQGPHEIRSWGNSRRMLWTKKRSRLRSRKK